jgi:NDP-sugar pyrophosphorylase family protein
MKIIIPMAGHSRRFSEAGYTIPKPYLMIDGKPMIERVCEMFDSKSEFVLVCNRDHLTRSDLRELIQNIPFDSKIIEINPHDDGPVVSALAARPLIDEEEPVIISYCDFSMDWSYTQFLRLASMHDGALAVFRGFHPGSYSGTTYCYVRANENLELEELREKQSFTDDPTQEFASTGIYYFEKWKTFTHYAEQTIQSGESVASEYYVSLLYNRMIQDHMIVGVYEVDKFICWGTPKDVQEYQFWSTFFRNIPHG